MTVRIIHAPKAGESWVPIYTGVKQVTRSRVIFHDGSELPKSITAKVEIISVMDMEYPDIFKQYPDEYTKIGNGTIADWRKLDLESFI